MKLMSKILSAVFLASPVAALAHPGHEHLVGMAHPELGWGLGVLLLIAGAAFWARYWR